jgi:signal transduction histidine kinase/ActR/RegA family two-component response regulator
MLPNASQSKVGDLLAAKYQNSPIDAIIYNGIPAITLMQSKEAFKPQAKHILLRYSTEPYQINSAVVPFELSIKEDYRSLIANVLTITNVDKVYLVYDPVDNLNINNIQILQKAVSDAGLSKMTELVAFTNLKELVGIFSNNIENAAVVISPILIKSDSSVVFPNKVAQEIAANISLPVFVHWETLLNNEVLGGYVISSQETAKATVLSLVQALNRGTPSVNSSGIYASYYNKAQLDERGISINRLPSRSTLYNVPADPLTLYFSEIVSSAIVMSCLILFVSILLNRNRLLKQQQIQLVNSDDKLRSANERLNAATTITQLGIWDYLRDSDEYVWDKCMCKHHGQDPAVFKPTLANWAGLLTNSDAAKLKDFLHQAINRGRDVRLEYPLKLSNGDTRHISLYCHAIVSIDQKTLQLVGTAQDISQQVDQQKQLKLERDKAQEAVEAKSLFIASMSHEIRTPMNAIVGSTEMLANSGLDETQAKHNALIKNSAQSMVNIVNDILDLARLENGKMKVERYPFNPSELIQQVLASFRSEINTKDLTLKYELENTLPNSLISDPLRIKQVLFNLVANAIKFTHHGHVGISVKYEQHTKANATSGTLMFIVQDSGIGIALEAQERIFEKFVQSDQDTFKKYGGSGLGLKISREIAYLLGGDLRVNSKLGEGSEFVFSVPTKMDVTNNRKQEAYLHVATPRLADKTVLIVDDSETNRVILEQALIDTHANMLFASNGQEAVDMFHSHKIDLILMDVLMPIMDGIEATKIIRTSDSALNNSELPIFSFTAQSREGDKDLCIGAGMDAYLTKPINQQLLFSTILSFPELSSPVTLASSSSFFSG